MIETTSTFAAAKPHAWQRAFLFEPVAHRAAKVSELKPLARFARKTPMHPRFCAASVDCRYSPSARFGQCASPPKTYNRIKALPITCISPVFNTFGVFPNTSQEVESCTTMKPSAQ